MNFHMSNFAVIKTGGKQYKVAEGDKIRIEKLPNIESGEAVFDDVLMYVNGSDIKIGTPKVEGVKVTAKVLKEGRTRKIIVFKYRAKKRYKKKAGHRQHFTEIQITKISQP
jgi:large subunit ribosomal protein L21